MDAHFVGSDPNLIPNPSPKGEGSQGTSLAVLQFVAIARGEWAVQVPRNAFRAEAVVEEQRYCLGCFGMRWFDVIRGTPLPTASPQMGERNLGGRCQVFVCRCCGATGEVI